MPTQRKVIIDTDAGVDDAVALFLALAAHKDPSVRFEILAITTSLGNTDVEHVCRNVFIVLDSAGVTDIPVYRGASTPLVQPFVRGEPPYFGKDGFGDIDPSAIPVTRTNRKLEDEFAPLALARLARQYQGELTLIALGPLTNLAIAINADPSFVKNVKDLYVMGGNIHGVGNIRPCSEFNFFVDPEAVFVVLSANWNEKPVLVPWETCKLAMSSLEWRTGVLGAIPSRQIQLLNLIEQKLLINYAKRYSRWVSADAVCMAVMLHPDIVTSKSTNYCIVELQGCHTRGQMVVDHPQRSGMGHNATLIEQINIPLLEELLIETFSGSVFPKN